MENKKLTVVGGGITGLAIAYMASKSGYEVSVIEGSDKLGGLLNTFEIGGNRLEYYYHHFFTHDAEIMWLIKELGIEDKLLFHDSTMGVFRNGKIYDFNTPIDLLKFSPINFIDKIRFGLTSLYLGKIAKWEKFEAVSSMDWFYKWVGKNTTNSLWKPLLDIKFGPFAHKVPLAWMIGRLRQRMNSRKKGDEKLGYISGSLQVLLNTLVNALEQKGVKFIKEAPLTDILVSGRKLEGIVTEKGEFKGGDFIFTLPSIYLSKIIKDKLPKLSEKLDEVEYFGAVCTILELEKPLSEIYWLNVADEGFPFGGIIEHTNLISKEHYNGSHIVYLSRYFAMNEDIASMSTSEIEDLMLPHLKKIYPNFNKDDIKKIYIFKTNTAATVCDLSFSEKVPNCSTELESMYLANMSHIYPDERSTNNSIRVAAEACKVMGIDTDYVPANASLSGKLGFSNS